MRNSQQLVPCVANQGSKAKKKFSTKEFEHEVFTNKKKLVILDNLVLDVESYIEHHPGGKFVLERNIGRDVSKFFFGGYSMMTGR